MKQMQKGQQKFAEGIQRVYAYPRDHEVMASFHSSYDGFDKALALVMMVSRKVSIECCACALRRKDIIQPTCPRVFASAAGCLWPGCRGLHPQP